MRSDVAFIIPVYNEETVVRGVVESVLREYTHVVCVNDCSRDHSADEIARTGAYLINHPINMGAGAATQTGLEFARRLPGINYFVTFDADGQHRVEDVEAMLAAMDERGDDVIIGSRFLGAKAVGMPWAKRVLLKLGTAFSNALSGVKLTDTHCGLRLFSRKVGMEMQITMPDMSHGSEILEIIAKKKYSYSEVPVTILYTDYSLSKGQPIVNAINIAFDTLLRKVTR